MAPRPLKESILALQKLIEAQPGCTRRELSQLTQRIKVERDLDRLIGKKLIRCEVGRTATGSLLFRYYPVVLP